MLEKIETKKELLSESKRWIIYVMTSILFLALSIWYIIWICTSHTISIQKTNPLLYIALFFCGVLISKAIHDIHKQILLSHTSALFDIYEIKTPRTPIIFSEDKSPLVALIVLCTTKKKSEKKKIYKTCKISLDNGVRFIDSDNKEICTIDTCRVSGLLFASFRNEIQTFFNVDCSDYDAMYIKNNKITFRRINYKK